MKKSKIKLIGCVLMIATLYVTALSATQYTPPPNDVVAQLLGWVPTPASPCFLCGGYFFEPKSIRRHPTPAPYETLPTKVTAKGPTIFLMSGESILQKDVRVIQTGRITQSDKAYIYREKHTGQITRINVVGHVRMQEHGKLLVSHSASLNLKKNTAHLKNMAYHLTESSSRMGHNDGWGTAKEADRLSNGIISLNQATYSTCSPLNPTWQIRAKHITLDRQKEKGVAKKVTLRLWQFPILFTPYLSFSINHVRKSGILAPLLENSTKSGFTVSLPYYWNMAPNYDMMITPTYFMKRGFQISSLFRYLTENSHGNLYLSYLPYDKTFQKFKNDIFTEFPEPISPIYRPYIDQLRKSESDRGYLAFNNHTQFNDRWSAKAQFNYVTDSYYLRDFGATINQVIANQLLNQLDLNYEGTHWNVTFLAQAYQTLHLISQFNDPTVNQYMRLPELDTAADYPNLFGNVDFTLNMQAVNFRYHSIFPPETDEMPIGQRFHLRPTFSQSITWASGYITPSFSLDSTTYNVSRPQPLQARSSTRNIPITDIDTGLYFNRPFHFRHHDYFQTLEPRLFYLYVPFENQDRYPVYDTQILPFTYAQLFARNRFTGFDRIQNANQISLGITSRILDSNDANQRLKASIGIGYYVNKPAVCLSPNCFLEENKHWTPLATELSFYPTPDWAVTGNFAWDTELSQTNNAQINLSYTRDGQHIIGGGYTFVHAQPSSPNYSTTSFSSDSALYSVFFAWPLIHHWSTVGYLFYNLSERRPENYFVGLQYDTCCISLRLIVDRTYLGTQPLTSGSQSINRYSTNYMFQIQFKGIGSAGNANPYAMLESNVPGYRDPFKY